MTHRLDHGQPLFPGDPATDLTGSEREAFFQRLEDEALEGLRHERNLKLAETDWTQNPDVPETTRNRWTTYRQALRDITETYYSVGDVVWPQKP